MKINTWRSIVTFLLVICYAVFTKNILITNAFAGKRNQYGDLGPLSIMYYQGETAKQQFGDVMHGEFTKADEMLYSVELAYLLDYNNIIRKIFHPIVDTVQIAGNIGLRYDQPHNDHMGEGDLYLVVRWTKFPWRDYLSSSFAIGDGISYLTHIPYTDRFTSSKSNDFRKLLNYLMLEMTFAMPSHPDWQLVARVHHRCTMYGVYGNSRGGSTNVGLGIRYYF